MVSTNFLFVLGSLQCSQFTTCAQRQGSAMLKLEQDRFDIFHEVSSSWTTCWLPLPCLVLVWAKVKHLLVNIITDRSLTALDWFSTTYGSYGHCLSQKPLAMPFYTVLLWSIWVIVIVTYKSMNLSYPPCENHLILCAVFITWLSHDILCTSLSVED
jgi:hypothetical protein